MFYPKEFSLTRGVAPPNITAMLCVRYRQYTFIKKSVSEHREIHGVGKTLIMLIQMFNSSGNWSRFLCPIAGCMEDLWKQSAIYGCT